MDGVKLTANYDVLRSHVLRFCFTSGPYHCRQGPIKSYVTTEWRSNLFRLRVTRPHSAAIYSSTDRWWV